MIFTLSATDLDRLRPLRLELHRHHVALGSPPGFAPREEDDAWQAWRTETERHVRDGDSVVLAHAESEDAEPDGFAHLCELSPEELVRPVMRPVGAHIELVTLVVAAPARDAGVGGALIDAACGWAQTRGAQSMHIVVRSGNGDALRFYHRLGAVDVLHTLLLPVEQRPGGVPA